MNIGNKYNNDIICFWHSLNNEKITTSNNENQIFKKWLDLVWLKHVDTFQNSTLLIADNFSPHTSEEISQTLATHDSFLHVIPSGCSSNLQPLHRGIKRLFKVMYLKNLLNI